MSSHTKHAILVLNSWVSSCFQALFHHFWTECFCCCFVYGGGELYINFSKGTWGTKRRGADNTGHFFCSLWTQVFVPWPSTPFRHGHKWLITTPSAQKADSVVRMAGVSVNGGPVGSLNVPVACHSAISTHCCLLSQDVYITTQSVDRDFFFFNFIRGSLWTHLMVAATMC